jgi:hypothetical protein
MCLLCALRCWHGCLLFNALAPAAPAAALQMRLRFAYAAPARPPVRYLPQRAVGWAAALADVHGTSCVVVAVLRSVPAAHLRACAPQIIVTLIVSQLLVNSACMRSVVAARLVAPRR